MILIGMFDSPFVRRVAITLHLLDMPFEHRNWSVGRDFDKIRDFNPLGRVPALVLPDGEVLIESAAILDHLDDLAGAARALIPARGTARRAVLGILAIASGAAEKGVLQVYENVFRPEAKRHEPWLDRCRTQMHGALRELERFSAARPGSWLIGDAITQADITVACVFTFLTAALGVDPAGSLYPSLKSSTATCEALQAFSSVRAEFFAPA